MHRATQPALVATRLALALAVALGLGATQAQTIERMKLTDGELTCAQLYAEVQQMDAAIQLSAPPPGSVPLPAPAVAGASPTATAAPADGGSLANLFGGLLGGGGVGAPGAAVPQGALAGLMPNQQGVPVGAYADPSVQRAIARARAAGYSDAQINAAMQLGAARGGYPVGAAAAAAGQVPLSAAAGGNNVQIAQQIHAQGQQSVAGLQGGVPAQAAAPAAPASPLGGLFGALAGGRAGGAPAASGLFGALAQSATQAAPPPVSSAPQSAPVSIAAGGQSAKPGGNLAAQAQARKEHLTGLFLQKGCKLSDVQKG
jgi:DNA polymerase-3 subunit gamma/tau